MSSTLDSLPTELARHRILNTREACEFVKISIPEWRRMRADGEAPALCSVRASTAGASAI
jgi:hypothetical protein